MEKVSIKDILVKTLFLLPLLFSMAWLYSLLTTKNTVVLNLDRVVLLSPVQNTKPIVVSLIIFMSGYAVFLAFVFSKNLRDAFKNESGK